MGLFRSSAYETATLNTEQIVSQAVGMVEVYTDSMKKELQTMEKQMVDFETEEEVVQYISVLAKTSSTISNIIIYDEQGEILLVSSVDEIIKTNLEQDLSFQPELFEKRNYEISIPHIENIFEYSYTWVATLGIPTKILEKDVYLVMDIYIYPMLNYLDNISVGQHGYCFIINEENEIVYHPQQELIYTGLKAENLNLISNMEMQTIREGNSIYAKEHLNNGEWQIVGVSYTEELINEQTEEAIQLLLINILWCIFVSIIITFVFSRRISKPIQELSEAMRAFERHADKYIPKDQSKIGIYEISILSESFDHMVRKIQELMERVKKEEKTLRKAELRALQTQINPHFLYNTLDSIQWMCEQDKSKDAGEMVNALAKLFRISISKGNELILIANELEHVRNYMVIQSYRYQDRFTYRFEIFGEIENYMCNKIMLQPLIENALLHGIDVMEDEGEIIIRVREEENSIVLSVLDNGIGMTEEQSAKILKHDTSDKFGIGIKNVNDRIKIYFGQEYGLTIESELDQGTAIHIRIPKITLEQYENNTWAQ
jgi:two-component system sensor histidine kinase YesM